MKFLFHFMLKPILLLIFIFNFSNSFSIDKAGFSLGATFGYCFTSHGVSFGLDLNVGLLKTQIKESPVVTGLCFSKSWTAANVANMHHIHKHNTLNLLIQSKNIDFKTGLGYVRNPWGYQNRNSCFVNGVNFDIQYKTPSIENASIGYRSFYYKRRNWRWLDQPYHTIYAGYGYDFTKNKN